MIILRIQTNYPSHSICQSAEQLIIIHHILQHYSMGCIQSKHQSNTPDSPQPFPQKLELAKIETVPPNFDSSFTLNLKLSQLLHNHQQHRGLISFYTLGSYEQRFDCNTHPISNNSQHKNNNQSGQCSSASQTYSSSESQKSINGDNLSHKSKILTNRSLNTEQKLDKKLFYINSAVYQGLHFEEWTDQNRIPVQITKQSISRSRQISYKMSVCLTSIYEYHKNSEIRLVSKKIKNGKNGYRIFFNGIKRLFLQSSPNFEDICSIISPQCDISQMQYHLTGWIPQILDLSKMRDKRQVFNRLTINYWNSALMVGLYDDKSQKYYILCGINAQREQVKLLMISRQIKEGDDVSEQMTLKWSQMVAKFNILSINWNPILYTNCNKIQVFVSHTKYAKLAIKIPPTKNDIQVRLLVQRHCVSYIKDIKLFHIHLCDCQPWATHSPEDQPQPLRSGTSVNHKFMTDTLIFQSSQQQTDYIICLKVDQLSQLYENNQFTINFYSFIPLSITNITDKQYVKTVSIKSQIKQENTGYAINSPYFYHNLHYSISLKTKKQCKITAQLCKQGNISLALVPDCLKMKDISLIKVQKMAHQFIQSDSDPNFAQMQFVSDYESYVLIVTSSKPIQSDIYIKLSVFDLFSDPTLAIEQLKFDPKFMINKKFRWAFENPGPRKRLQSNTKQLFYEEEVFREFFKNPLYDFQLGKGIYQICVLSETFSHQVKEGLKNKKNPQFLMENLCPPSLSLGLFLISEGKKRKFKILHDDTLYVPFGMGFWSQPIELQQGKYRIVMPKMQKKDGMGNLKIRKLEK